MAQFSIQASAKPRTARIEIRGTIGDWWDGVDSQNIAYQLQSLGEIDTIHLVVNSRGGAVDEAISIFTQLKAHPARIVALVEGIAASAATIPLMAADVIRMPANTSMMVHAAALDLGGYGALSADELRAGADLVDTGVTALVETYKARTGLDDSAVRELLKKDTWMTAAQAVELGFADEVIELHAVQAASAVAAASDMPASHVAALVAIEAASGDAAGERDPAPIDFTGEVATLAQAAGRPEMAVALAAQANADGHVHGVRSVLAMATPPAPPMRAQLPSTTNTTQPSAAQRLAQRSLMAINPNYKPN